MPDLVLVRRRRFRQVPDREVEVRQLLRGLFLGFGEPAERIVVVDTPEPQGPTELVTIAQLENRLADSVRSAWLGVPSLFSDWFCSQELLVSIGDSLRRGCPLLDLDSKLTGMLADRDTLNAYLTTEIHFQNLGFVLDISEAVSSLILPCLLVLHKRSLLDEVRGWLLNGEEADPFPWPLNGVN